MHTLILRITFVIFISVTNGYMQNNTSCTQYQTFLSSSGNFSLNSDVWNPVPNGGQCVMLDANETSWTATWNWTSNDNDVHSYPHIKFLSGNLPAILSHVSSLNISASWSTWSYSTGGARVNISSSSKWDVAIDMFADVDPTLAQNETTAGYEIMVWVGKHGEASPIGYSNGSKMKIAIDNKEFLLYTGTNHRGGSIHTWVCSSSLFDFNIDISHLLKALWRDSLVPANASLGLVEFGTETVYSKENVTFRATNYNMQLETVSKVSGSARIAAGPFSMFDLGAIIFLVVLWMSIMG